ncbi:kinase [Methylorubrum salsuginis]|uniref:Predicted kinase n=1 Tax=Methylorubrum salsuginis TaxID=414703 RepID=A0A1I3ZWS2_9HYPH|nr:kinase [Methylorubrum salsuginis]SFK47999.1 Predicted kinase [Methylorubrum salsuginis]
MPDQHVIDPDSFLETEGARVWTPERSAEAWRTAFARLEARLTGPAPPRRIVVVCGLQGAGKSTWVAAQDADADTLYFDAALPGMRHRRPILIQATRQGIPVEAVWIRVPLTVALARNAMRRADRIVPEASIRSVERLFEPPTQAEGFARVTVIDAA